MSRPFCLGLPPVNGQHILYATFNKIISDLINCGLCGWMQLYFVL